MNDTLKRMLETPPKPHALPKSDEQKEKRPQEKQDK